MQKHLISILIMVVLLAGCKNDSSKTSGNKSKSKSRPTLTSSSGRINTLPIIIGDSLWKGEVGESLRDEFTAPVKGLPQQEPLFSLSHIPSSAFTGLSRKHRIYINISLGDEKGYRIVRDSFARPQTGIYISGKSPGAISAVIKKWANGFTRVLKQTEIREKQRRINKSLKGTKKLENRLGITLNFPTAYRYAEDFDDFVWLRKDIPHGSMELLAYQVPLNVIDKDTNTVKNIIEMRDSVSKRNIPGPEEGQYMQTEEAYAPYLFERKIDGKFAYLTKGTWLVKGAFMGGPFINYAVRDEKNDRYVVLEGFVFKPNAPSKRDNIFELDAILQSVKIK